MTKNIKNIDRVLKYKKALNFGKVFQERGGARPVSFTRLILIIVIIFLIFPVNVFATAWEVEDAVYENKYKDISDETVWPYDIAFSSDGTKMYLNSYSSPDLILQYALSTAWDVSTASYADIFKDVTAQDSDPWSIFFKPDGTKMYVAGDTHDSIYQYTLSTPWNISTATYANKSEDVGSQVQAPKGVVFKPDGSKMYVADLISKTIYQYNLTTNWDVSTASYAAKSKDVSSETTPKSLFFSSDGTKMYTANVIVHQYTLSTAWDVSTATYSSKYKDTSDQDQYGVEGIFFKPDGSKMYVLGSYYDKVYQYTLLAPPAPTNVAATDGTHTDKVTVTWTKSDGATGYQVYRNGVALGWLGDVATYNDTGADVPTITAGTASASDGTSADHVTLSIAGESANNGTTHTYKVRAKNTAGESGDSTTNTGYRGVGALTYQWQRSAEDSDADYSNIDGTTDPYNDTGAPENGDGRYYKCVENATGASQEISSSNRGYRMTTPTVTISAATNVEATTATGNGNITDTGGEDCDKRGFVYDTSAKSKPGNVAPGASGYANYAEDTDGFGTGAFTKGLTGLTPGTKYYIRAYAHNSAGYNYSDTELEFTTGLAPIAPTALYSNNANAQAGKQNPTGITDGTPVFSAKYNDLDLEDIANKYRVQVATSSDFAFSSRVWDSGSSGTSMSNCAEGDRCQDIEYASTTVLSLDGTKYYWRIKFWDAGAEGDWSTETAHFTMASRELDTSTNTNTLRLGADRHTFYDGSTYYWAFYIDDNSHIVYEKSSDGVTWNGTVIEVATSTTYSSLGIWEDGTDIWTAYNSTTTSYSRKITISNGALNTEYSTSTADRYHPQIIKDSGGFLWRKEEAK